MPNLGKKYSCYSCHTKFYDLGKPVPLCPKCGADQRDSDDTPVVSTRGRRVIEEPLDDEFEADDEVAAPKTPLADEEDGAFEAEAEPEPEADEEEEEY